jgi:hypothetical protein
MVCVGGERAFYSIARDAMALYKPWTTSAMAA